MTSFWAAQPFKLESSPARVRSPTCGSNLRTWPAEKSFSICRGSKRRLTKVIWTLGQLATSRSWQNVFCMFTSTRAKDLNWQTRNQIRNLVRLWNLRWQDKIPNRLGKFSFWKKLELKKKILVVVFIWKKILKIWFSFCLLCLQLETVVVLFFVIMLFLG